MSTVDLGIDFGSTGLRAACSVPGESVRLLTLPGPDWLLCEPVRSSELAVVFPSIKSKLGGNRSISVDGRQVGVSGLVTESLRAVRQWAESDGAVTVAHTVISVPARYTSAQRTALRGAALDAGLTEVRLINDSVAGVIAHSDTTERGGTYLVYGMGYSGFELGLVRVVGKHYRVLGHDGAGTPGGSMFDRQVLLGWLATLRRYRLRPGIAAWDPTTWLELRELAQSVKEQLVDRDDIPFPVPVSSANGDPHTITFNRDNLRAVLRDNIATTLVRARSLLEQSALTVADIDTVLLVGGSTTMRPVQALIADGLGAPLVLGGPELLACGALFQASRLGRVPLSGHEDRIISTADDAEATSASPPPLAATVVGASGATGSPTEPVRAAAAPPPPVSQPPGLQDARQLLEQGQPAEAAALLHRIVAEAQALLHEIAAATAQRRLAMARTQLAQGRHQEAVAAAHAAWQQAPDDPDVFEEMIAVHCDAAAAEPGIERFPNAIRWLQCAYELDRSNMRVRKLLADRTLEHARQLSKLRRRAEALDALTQCLTWDPERQEAKELQQTLLRRQASRR